MRLALGRSLVRIPVLTNMTVVSSWFSSVKKANAWLDFYYHDPFDHLISLSKFNLPLIGTFTWPAPPGPYRATTCRGRELNYGSHTYFFDYTRTWRASLDEWSAQCRGHLRGSTNMKDNTHQALSHPNKANVEWWLRRPNDIRGTWGLKFPDISLTGEGKSRKNLPQETCPDRGTNPGPLCDRRACYHLLHSGGQRYLYYFLKWSLNL